MKKYVCLYGKKLLLAPFILYVYDLIMGSSSYFIPINLITILVVGFLDIFGLLILILLLFIVWEVIDVLEEYKESQSIFYNYIVNSVNNDCISHAYLIETNGVSYGLNLAVSLAKFFLCKNNDKKKDRIIYKQVHN